MSNYLKVLSSFFIDTSLRAQGPDLSHWDISFDPTLAKQRIDFAIMKLTEGAMFVDPSIGEIWQGVKQVFIRGAYHYQRSSMSWKLQADLFLSYARRYDFHIYALDLESKNNIYDDTFFSDTRRIIDYWRPQALGKKIILYTNWSTYDRLYAAIVRLYSDGAQWMDALDLWYAWPSSLLKEPVLPLKCKAWRFWQWSWTGTKEDWGTGSFADLNFFNGTQADLARWAGITSQPPESR